MRTPVKTILFLLLVTFAAALSTVGINLWQMSNSNMNDFEKVFTTIGTIEQKKSVLNKMEQWDAMEQTSRYYYGSKYNPPIPLSVLDFDGANYIQKTEKRPFYGAYLPDYQLFPPDRNGGRGVIIVEFTVNEDCVPDHKIEINIEKQIYTKYRFNTTTVWFCDRYNPNPDQLYAGKTYVMAMLETPYRTNDTSYGYVYTPIEMIGSWQYSEEGEVLPDEMQGILYEEVTEGFYETEHGKRWLNLVECMELPYHTIPVTATNSTNLLMPFYSGTSYIITGEDISEEEYAHGDKVCLVSNSFARINNLVVGDKIMLPLYYANYRDSAGGAYRTSEVWAGFNMLNAKGEPYPVFYEAEYTIVGLVMTVGGGSSGYTMAKNEVIIPTKSIQASDKDNIVAYGPMMGYTTSFQIPNGSMKEYKEAFQKLGLDELELRLYDKGYTELRAGLDNIRSMAFILLAAGVIATVLILVFFCNLFITKQKKRTAIERSLGMSKWKCTQSMISGILLIVLFGSLIGSLMGYLLTSTMANVVSGSSSYDLTYTIGSVRNSVGGETVAEYAYPAFSFSAITCAIIILFAFMLALAVIANNLRYEPLELLSEKTE
jgi:hypothetical protein